MACVCVGADKILHKNPDNAPSAQKSKKPKDTPISKSKKKLF